MTGLQSSDLGNGEEPTGHLVAGKYRIEGLLAEGGMGAVFRANHERLDRPVAIKLLHARLLKREDYVKRFHHEAKRAASIGHPGIVDVRDFGWDDSWGPFLEMELLEGANVDQLVKAGGPLPPEVALLIMSETLDAVAAAHAMGIVHRDLKPVNIFIATGATGIPKVKILDFGIAKIFGDHVDEQTMSEVMTQHGVIMGTLNYMAPEQFAGSAKIDNRADLYALGASMFEMLTGTPILKPGSFPECVERITGGHVEKSPRAYNAEVSKRVELIVQRALERRRSNRYQSATEMLKDVERAREVDAPTVRKALGQLVARRMAVGGAAARHHDAAQDTIVLQRKRRKVSPWAFISLSLALAGGAAGWVVMKDGRGNDASNAVPEDAGNTQAKAPQGSIPLPRTASAPSRQAGSTGATSHAAGFPDPRPTYPDPQPTARPATDAEEAANGATDTVEDEAETVDDATVVARATGRLSIQSVPSARVFVNGRDIGRSTPISGLRLPAGRHRVGLKPVQGKTHEYLVTVRAGEGTRLSRVLPK